MSACFSGCLGRVKRSGERFHLGPQVDLQAVQRVLKVVEMVRVTALSNSSRLIVRLKCLLDGLGVVDEVEDKVSSLPGWTRLSDRVYTAATPDNFLSTYIVCRSG